MRTASTVIVMIRQRYIHIEVIGMRKTVQVEVTQRAAAQGGERQTINIDVDILGVKVEIEDLLTIVILF